jgi:hypothetical protein
MVRDFEARQDNNAVTTQYEYENGVEDLDKKLNK